ncbi:Tumor necrosis factor-inducible protein6 protein [Holothuria leucospilota]|uniref:Tumor necrosis factor-inducible protein6 protein n=1 Tax=Holothuria leucospilota TaxID=206669 RepID=A0A9Q1H4J5_HOLLE|nr:Tumor necrosis factor-inducible protein6 protein [Holothuria leucospilota]
MMYQRQHRGSLQRRISLFMVANLCLYAGLTTGNSIVVLNKPSGLFQSPGYPDLDDDMHLIWKVIAPLHHKIILTFLDFDLVEMAFCIDEIEIYEGNNLKGTYRGTQLHQKSITSTSNTISIVLMSCPTSLWNDRKGIRVSFSTGSLYAIIGAVLALLFVLMIIAVLFIRKRREARFLTSDSATHAETSGKNQENGYFTTVASERTTVKSLGHDYEEANETQKDMSGVYYSRGIVSKSWGSSRPQNKHLKFDAGSKLGVGLYENNISNTRNKTVDDQDYSHEICRSQQASLTVAYVNNLKRSIEMSGGC